MSLGQDRVGHLIDGRYRLLELLGSGLGGSVYRAEQINIGREVAVRMLGESSVRAAEAFVVEARVISQLRHPNILHLFDFGRSSGELYLVTELLHGESVEEARAAGRIDSLRARQIAVEAADALVAAHGAGVVHGELSARTLFLDRVSDRTVVKILDFGLPRARVSPAEDLRALEAVAASLSAELVSRGAADARALREVFRQAAVKRPDAWVARYAPELALGAVAAVLTGISVAGGPERVSVPANSSTELRAVRTATAGVAVRAVDAGVEERVVEERVQEPPSEEIKTKRTSVRTAKTPVRKTSTPEKETAKVVTIDRAYAEKKLAQVGRALSAAAPSIPEAELHELEKRFLDLGSSLARGEELTAILQEIAVLDQLVTRARKQHTP